MSSEEAITHTDIRDPIKNQFSPQEVDFLEFNMDLKMIDVRKMDRVYLQTSYIPYFQDIAKQHKNNCKLVEAQNIEATSDSYQNNTHHSSLRKEIEVRSPESTEENSTFDVVFGDSVKAVEVDPCLCYVYKNSDAHILDEIHNLVQEKLKSNSLESCFPEPKSKIIINICSRWYRAFIVSWPPRIPGNVLVKLVDLGRYVDVDKKTICCYKVPEEINQRPLAFQMRVDKHMNAGSIARVEQVNSSLPLEAKVLNDLGIQDNGIPLDTKNEDNYFALDSKTNINKRVVNLNTPLKVFMLSKEEDYYWVQDSNISDIYAEWHDTLESNTKREFTELPRCGQYCLKNCEYMWRRSLVRSENPLRIFYIDYGYEETISNPKDLKPMPKICLSHKPFAFKIKWAKEKNSSIVYEYEEELTITPIDKVNDNTYLVLKPGEHEDWTYQDKLINICASNMEMKKSQEVFVVDKTNDYLVVSLSNGLRSKPNDYNNIGLLAKLDDSHDLSCEDIKEGDYVLVLDSQSSCWHRALMINKKKSVFYLIDTGKNSISPKQCKSLLNNMWEMPPQVVKIVINQSLLKLCKVKSTIEIFPLHMFDNNTIVAQLLMSSMFAIESPPPLTLHQKITALFATTDAIDNSISYFFTHFDQFSSTLLEMHALIKNCTKLIPVHAGDYCGVLQDDEIYCRAKVLKSSDDDETVTVFMIDFGVVDIVDASKCRELPDQVYAYPPCITKTKPLPLNSVVNLDVKAEIVLLPEEEISRRVYSVRIVS